MKHNKLVRDKIPNIIKQNQEVPTTHIANDEEYFEKLKQKLQEEVNEFLENENKEELADILEIVHAICNFKNINKQEIELLRKNKLIKRGGFKERIILEETK